MKLKTRDQFLDVNDDIMVMKKEHNDCIEVTKAKCTVPSTNWIERQQNVGRHSTCRYSC